MKVFNTATLNEAQMKHLSPNQAAWIYNGLDVCVTSEIYNTLEEVIDNDEPCVKQTYETALAKLAPILEMSLRGTRIDETRRQETIRSLEKDLKILNERFQRIMLGVFGSEVNWNSPLQLKTLFYGCMGLKEIKKRNSKGQFTATVNREALEYFDNYLYARPIARLILLLRNISKQLGFLKTEIDRDQRIRCNYNITGTNTGRLASSMNDFGTGTNLQNVNRMLRFPFVSDPGMYMFNIDLEQADGRNVGAICWNLFYDMSREEIYSLAEGDPRLAEFCKDGQWIGPVGEELAGAYINACESGDLHTTVCKMVWPDQLNGEAWPADEPTWKSFCDGLIAHGQDSYRQLSKKGGHGTNYYGTPRTMSKHLHTPVKVIDNFQALYFRAFPAIPLWHNWVIKQIVETSSLTTLFGRRRTFFGRPKEATTHRKAIAYEPQSMTGEQIDRGLLAVWRKFPEVNLLNQVHDSILLQLPFARSEELAPEILKCMTVTLVLKGGRQFAVPLDAAGGWNWGYFDKKKPGLNPHGLSGWKGKEMRQPPAPTNRLMDFLRK